MCRLFLLSVIASYLVSVSADQCSARLDEFENKLYELQGSLAEGRLEDAEKIKQLEKSIERQDRLISLTGIRLNDLGNTLETFDKQHKRQVNVNEGRAAFSAYLDHDLDGVTNHQTIVFNQPLHNDGTYDATTGVFTAPVDGIYLFIYFIGNRHAREVDAELLLNGVKQNEAVAEGVQGAHDTQGGNSAILQLSMNDRVWVDTTLGDHVEGAWRFSSFTGALLYSN